MTDALGRCVERPVRLLLSCVLGTAACGHAGTATALGPVVSLERVSVSNSGAQAAGDSLHAVVSADGRYVAFDSSAAGLASDLPALPVHVPAVDFPAHVYLRDRQTGTTELISIAIGGAPATGPSYWPAISADGRYVAFSSDASNLVSGDINGRTDVFVRDRVLGQTVRASVVDGGTATNGGGQSSSDDNSPNWISADGRYVVFESSQALTANANNGQFQVFRRDLVAGQTVLVSATPANTAANVGADSGSISGDGRRVVFRSASTDVSVDASPSQVTNLYVRDMDAGVTVSLTSSVGTPGPCAATSGQSGTHNISRNGRFVAFDSNCDLVAGQSPNDHVFVRDLLLGSTNFVRLNSDGSAGALGAYSQVSNSGRFFMSWSQAMNIVPGDTDVFADVFLRDRTSAQTWRVSQRADTGLAANQNSYSPYLGSGGHIAFASDADNLVDGDSNGRRDIFLATLDQIFASGFD